MVLDVILPLNLSAHLSYVMKDNAIYFGGHIDDIVFGSVIIVWETRGLACYSCKMACRELLVIIYVLQHNVIPINDKMYYDWCRPSNEF